MIFLVCFVCLWRKSSNTINKDLTNQRVVSVTRFNQKTIRGEMSTWPLDVPMWTFGPRKTPRGHFFKKFFFN